MAQRKERTNISFIAKKIGFIIRNFWAAGRKTEEYLKKYVEVAIEIGVMGILGQASLELGMLYKTIGQTD